MAQWLLKKRIFLSPHQIRRIVAPKREKLEAALESLHQKEAALAEAEAQLQKLREELKSLQEMYDAKMKEKEDLIRLVSGLSYDRLFALTSLFPSPAI